MKSLDFLQPVLSLLANNLDGLLVVGSAVEETLQADVEEIEDMFIHAEDRAEMVS